MDEPIFRAVPPRLPRSWTEPSFSQSTACGPNASGGSTVFPHRPDAPTAWPRSLIERAIPTVSPGSGEETGCRQDLGEVVANLFGAATGEEGDPGFCRVEGIFGGELFAGDGGKRQVS